MQRPIIGYKTQTLEINGKHINLERIQISIENQILIRIATSFFTDFGFWFQWFFICEILSFKFDYDLDFWHLILILWNM